ncbi:hypothetical protein [Maridesulfovibrio salexigens]|uniref:Uncharacterized protein n=1 Tax=Maridesulfovibrio salexigens (strain ATCC 14822 / DSM 2638 / NCIMB 8403 / VKM B-1763) TaxID=526222 RepID=C6BXW6_MARSD|nr:hypothetical protein [Maridesulfovibrio salexigens]ACS78674.1 hypothetical protein Desal_0608 [Maridesulfovibrio salexigens DSM 2638]
MNYNKIKNFSINTILILVSILVCCWLIDKFVFNGILSNLPLNRHEFVERPLRVFAQSSKKDLIPQNDYIGIIGDSYAQGKGDWLLEADKTKNSPFNAAHILHDLSGYDVVSFGRSGADNPKAVAQFVDTLDYASHFSGLPLSAPKQCLVYFYAGNDLRDNMTRMEVSYKGYDISKVNDPEYFQNFLASFVESEKSYSIVKWSPSLTYMTRILFAKINSAAASFAGAKSEDNSKHDWPYQDANIIKLTDTTVKPNFPRLDMLTLNLTQNEIKLGLYIFEQSLIFLKNNYPDTIFYVVYVPSVLECYEYESDLVIGDRTGNKVNVDEAMRIAQQVENSVQEIAQNQNLLYFDTLPYLRKAAKHEMLHGPVDVGHLNQKGYTVLGEALNKFIAEINASGNIRKQ